MSVFNKSNLQILLKTINHFFFPLVFLDFWLGIAMVYIIAKFVFWVNT